MIPGFKVKVKNKIIHTHKNFGSDYVMKGIAGNGKTYTITEVSKTSAGIPKIKLEGLSSYIWHPDDLIIQVEKKKISQPFHFDEKRLN